MFKLYFMIVMYRTYPYSHSSRGRVRFGTLSSRAYRSLSGYQSLSYILALFAVKLCCVVEAERSLSASFHPHHTIFA